MGHLQGLKPTLILLAFPGVKTPGSLRFGSIASRLTPGLKSRPTSPGLPVPAYQSRPTSPGLPSWPTSPGLPDFGDLAGFFEEELGVDAGVVPADAEPEVGSGGAAG